MQNWIVLNSTDYLQGEIIARPISQDKMLTIFSYSYMIFIIPI